MIRKIESHYRVIEALQAIVQEENVPVEIMIGKETIDYNGDKQVEACLEFAEADIDIVNAALNNAVSNAINLIFEEC